MHAFSIPEVNHNEIEVKLKRQAFVDNERIVPFFLVYDWKCKHKNARGSVRMHASTQEQTRPDPKPGASGLGPARVRREGYFTWPGFSGRPEPVQCSSRSRYWLWNGHRQPSSRPWFISECSRGPTLQVPMWETIRTAQSMPAGSSLRLLR